MDNYLMFFLSPDNEHMFNKVFTKEQWESIQSTVNWNINYYNHLYEETQDEHIWDAITPEIWSHWNLIKHGIVPFGFVVEGE